MLFWYEKLPIYIGCIATLFLLTFGFDVFNLPKLMLLCALVGLLIASFPRVLDHRRTTISTLNIALLFFITFQFFNALNYSPNFSFGLVGAWGRNTGLIAYLCVAIIHFYITNIKSDLTEYTLKTLSWLGFGLSIYGIMQLTGNDLFPWTGRDGPAILTLGNTNFASAILAITTLATLINFYGSISGTRKSYSKPRLLLASSLVQAFVLYKTNSTQGIVAIFIGLSILVIAIIFSKPIQVTARSIGIFTFILFVAVLMLILLMKKGSAYLSSASFSFVDRFYHWESAIQMIREFPLFGVGLDSFGFWYAGFRSSEAIALRGTPNSFTNNAHNVILQIGATGGLTSLVPFLIIIGIITLYSLRILKSREVLLLERGVASLWLVYLSQAFVSIDQIGLMVWGWIIGGLVVQIYKRKLRLVATESPINGKNSNPEKVLNKILRISRSLRYVVIGILFTTFSLNMLVPRYMDEVTVKNNMKTWNYIQTQQSINNTETLGQLSNKISQAAISSGSPQIRQKSSIFLIEKGYTQQATEILEFNVAQYPRDWEAWRILLRIRQFNEEWQEAAVVLSKLREIDPLNDSFENFVSSKDVP